MLGDIERISGRTAKEVAYANLLECKDEEDKQTHRGRYKVAKLVVYGGEDNNI